jgi:Protein of unknown function (DUF3311).
MTNKKLVPLLLAAIPCAGLTVAIPFVNRVEPFVWGMPFLLWWIFVNVMLTPIWMGMAFLYEKRQKKLSQTSGLE